MTSQDFFNEKIANPIRKAEALIGKIGKEKAIRFMVQQAESNFSSLKGKYKNKSRLLFGSIYERLANQFRQKSDLEKGLDWLSSEELKTLTGIMLGEFQLRRASMLLMLWGFQHDDSPTGNYSFEKVKLLNEAKFLFFSLVIESNEKRLPKELEKHMPVIWSNLALCLMQLNRFVEPWLLLDRAIGIPIWVFYNKARLLDAIMGNTCIDEYPILQFHIYRFCKSALGMPKIDEAARKQAKDLGLLAESRVIELGESIQVLHNDWNKNLIEARKRDDYRAFVLGHHLSLNEHSNYCNCSLSENDDLKIRTTHTHTQIPWVDEKEKWIELLKGEFKKAVREFHTYVSANDENKNPEDLKVSFRYSYGVLDKIARYMLVTLDVSLTPKEKVYFTDIFEKLKNTHGSDKNFFIYTLYSIAEDLNHKSPFSALKDYKFIRDKMEHEGVQVVFNEQMLKSKDDGYSIGADQLQDKTYHLLQLVRSAIFSLVYLIRFESIERAKISPNEEDK